VSAPPAHRSLLPVIIDTDPGIDDTLALLLALRSPELDVRGISVTYGNTVVENAHRNALEILRRTGRRLPVAIGARRPLKRGLAVALETHGPSGLGYAAVPPAGSALDFVKPLDRLLADQPEPVTLVTLGPLTSLALALRREPEMVRAKVARHIAMVGAFGAPGNTTPFSEFNAWCDPEALAQVLAAQLPSELVGLDVTRKVVVTAKEVDRLTNSDDPDAQWLGEALRFYVDFHRMYEELEGCVVNDVLPIAALIRPECLVYRPLLVRVDLEDGDHRGHTRIDPDGQRAQVASDVRLGPVRALLTERVLPWLAPSEVGS
jgi:inosine-uridine nucleoside N-ribohydrolase